MGRTAAIVLIAFLALSKVNGDEPVKKIKVDLENAANQIEKESSEARQALKYAIGNYFDSHADLKNKAGRIHALYDRASKVVDESPEECKGDLKKNLMVLKSSGVGSFLTCSKLLEAGEDIADILVTTGDLVMDVADIGADFFTGFSGCLSSFWPWNIIGCWWDRMKTSYDDVKRTISDVKNYASTVSGYAHNASILLKYCWDGNTVEADVLEAMTPLHQCAHQPVPYNLYKL